MATIVSQIITNAEALAATTFGATYQRLKFVYEVTKNDVRGATLAYGIRPLSAIPVDGITRTYTVDHTFELVLMDTTARDLSDDERRAALNTMYDKADEYFKALVSTKLSLANLVWVVQSPSMSEPEVYPDQKFVVLRMQFVVKYRSSLS